MDESNYLGLKDKLGNRLHKFDVVAYGARSGTGSINNIVCILSRTAAGFIRGVRRVRRFQTWDQDGALLYAWVLEETTVRLPADVVKIHDSLYNDETWLMVQEAKEAYRG